MSFFVEDGTETPAPKNPRLAEYELGFLHGRQSAIRQLVCELARLQGGCGEHPSLAPTATLLGIMKDTMMELLDSTR